MASADPGRIRELKLAAKWSSDNYGRKRTILQLLQSGDEALPAIQEVLTITFFDNVKQTCIEAIGLLGMEQKSKQTPDNKIRTARRTRKTRKAMTNSQKAKK